MSAIPASQPERDTVWEEVRERLHATLNDQTFTFAFADRREHILAAGSPWAGATEAP